MGQPQRGKRHPFGEPEALAQLDEPAARLGVAELHLARVDQLEKQPDGLVLDARERDLLGAATAATVVVVVEDFGHERREGGEEGRVGGSALLLRVVAAGGVADELEVRPDPASLEEIELRFEIRAVW